MVLLQFPLITAGSAHGRPLTSSSERRVREHSAIRFGVEDHWAEKPNFIIQTACGPLGRSRQGLRGLRREINPLGPWSLHPVLPIFIYDQFGRPCLNIYDSFSPISTHQCELQE